MDIIIHEVKFHPSVTILILFAIIQGICV